MADKRYTVSEVLELLEGEELLEDDVSDIVCTVDLNAESEDSDVPEGDGTDCDGSAVLVPSEYLDSEAMQIIANGIDGSSPAERDSLLLTDSEQSSSDEGKQIIN